MRRMALILGMCLTVASLVGCSLLAEKEGKEDKGAKKEDMVMPVDPELNYDYPLRSGVYVVDFVEYDKIDSSGSVKVDIYTFDRYDKDDIDDLKKGSKIFYNGEELTVKKITSADVEQNIEFTNGDTIQLTLQDDSFYRSYGENAIPAYYKVATKDVDVHRNVMYIDSSYSDTIKHEMIESKDLTDLLNKGNEQKSKFSHNNTYIVVEDGYLTQINTFFVE